MSDWTNSGRDEETHWAQFKPRTVLDLQAQDVFASLRQAWVDLRARLQR